MADRRRDGHRASHRRIHLGNGAHLGKQWRILAGLYSDHELVRTGPYSIVRHPVYLGMLGMFLAGGLMETPWPAFLLALAVFIAGTEIRVRIEDDLLARRFGAEWRAWRAKTPAYLPFKQSRDHQRK